MKLAVSLAAAGLFAISAAPAVAAATVIDFEGATSFSSIADYYNGGTDGAGASGANLGLSFSGAALALSNDGLGTGDNGDYYSNAPTNGTVMFATDDSAVLNISQGIVGTFSFYYSSLTAAANAVTLYSGLNGTGSILGTISLDANATANGCASAAFCHWQQAALNFGGVAQSISFANAGNVAFDNLAVTAVPEPQSVVLMAMGLALLGGIARRQRRG